MWIVRIPDIHRSYQSISREVKYEQLSSTSFDSINSNLSSLTVCECLPVDGDFFSNSDTQYNNPDTLINDLSDASVDDNSDFDFDTDNSYIEDSNSTINEHGDASSENNSDLDSLDPVDTDYLSDPKDISSYNNFPPLSLLLINLQSIGNKKESFWEMLDNYSPDIVIGCETWLNSSILDNEIMPQNYKLYRRDRDDGYGGVLIGVSTNLPSEPVDIETLCEVSAVSIRLSHNQELIVIGAYRPPSRDITYQQNLCKCICDTVASRPNSFIFCAGDFNVPDVQWTSHTIVSHRYPVDINQLILKMVDDCYFTQLVDSPTRNENILDIIFTNRPSLINYCNVISGISDHEAVLTSFMAQAVYHKEGDRKRYLWNKANFQEMNIELSRFTAWFCDHFNIDTPVECLWSHIKSALLSLLDKYVPSKVVKNSNKQPWVNHHIKQLSRRKKKCYKIAKANNSSSEWLRYKSLKREIQRECRKARNSYMARSLFDPFKSGRKKNFFRYIKSLRKDSCGISMLQSDGITYSNNVDKAEILNKHFASVFTQDDNSPAPDLGSSPYPDLQSFGTSVEEVYNLLTQVDPFKATGPDDIPPKLLKEMAFELSPSLTVLFNSSLKQGKIPHDWKIASVTPIHKKGNRSNPTNYRPISLTSVCCKTLERIIHSNIMEHLNRFNVLSKCQYGFRANHSTELQLLHTVHDLVTNLNKKIQTDAILLDLTKAFDKVLHRFLLHKLHYYGIRNEILEWISSFLSDRTQYVTCNGSKSSIIDVISGVPQGTVLGPLLFLVYINDLPNCVLSSCSLFADDCLLYRPIYTEDDNRILQDDLLRIEEWANKWKMIFNTDKCEVLQVTLSNLKPTSYFLYNSQLSTVSHAKYLGVLLDSKLNFNNHVATICRKANNVLALLKRNLYHCNSEIRSQAYFLYVRPILEYASTVWAPHTKSNVDKIESVQRRAARFVVADYDYSSSVTSILNRLKWSSLDVRRQVNRLMMFHKILQGSVALNLPQEVSLLHTTTRGHDRRYQIPFSRIDVHKFSFFPATVRLWNGLPDSVVHLDSLESFRRSVTDFLNNYNL